MDMSDIRALAQQQNVSRSADANWVAHRATRDGSVFTANWFQAFALEGRVFSASAGSLATPVSAANAAVTSLRPMAVLRVPAATTIIPISVRVVPRAIAGTVNDFIIAYCQNDVGSATSTAMTAGPVSFRTDAPLPSAVVARQLYTADCTAPTNPIELVHRADPYAQSADAAGVSLGIEVAFPDTPETALPVLVGPASLLVYVGATTTGPTFYASFVWAEVPSSAVT